MDVLPAPNQKKSARQGARIVGICEDFPKKKKCKKMERNSVLMVQLPHLARQPADLFPQCQQTHRRQCKHVDTLRLSSSRSFALYKSLLALIALIFCSALVCLDNVSEKNEWWRMISTPHIHTLATLAAPSSPISIRKSSSFLPSLFPTFIFADAQTTPTTANNTSYLYNLTESDGCLRVLFLFPTSLSDLGWSYQFNIARRRAIRDFVAANPNITLIDNAVYDVNALTADDFNMLVETSLSTNGPGYHIVFGLSSSVFPRLFNFSTRYLAAFPKTRFIGFSLPKLLDGNYPHNYAAMGLDIQTASFVIGAVAAAACTPGSGGVGILMPTTMPSAVNAFYRGMLYGQKFRPEYNTTNGSIASQNGTTTMCQLVTINQNSFSDVPSEIEIANLFIQRNMRVAYFWVDHRDAALAVMHYHQLAYQQNQSADPNYDAASIVDDNDMWSISYAVEGTTVVGDSVVTSLLIRGGDVFQRVMQDYIDNVPTSETFYVIPMHNVSDDNGIQLGYFSAAAPQYVSKAGASARMYASENPVLCGPIYSSSSGALMVPPGSCLNISQMTLNMTYIMQGNIYMMPPWRRASSCPPGTFVNRSLDTFELTCQPCPAGMFSSRNGSASCSSCPHELFEIASADGTSCVLSVTSLEKQLSAAEKIIIGVLSAVCGLVIVILLIYYLVQSYRFGTFLWPAHYGFFDFSGTSQAVLAVQHELFIAGEVERMTPPQGPFVALAMIAVDNSRSDPRWRKSISFVGDVYAELGKIVNQAAYDARRHAELVAAVAPPPTTMGAAAGGGGMPPRTPGNWNSGAEFANVAGDSGASTIPGATHVKSPTATTTGGMTGADFLSNSASVNSAVLAPAAPSGVYIAINVGDMYVLAHNDADVLLKCVAQIDKRFRRFMTQLHAQKKQLRAAAAAGGGGVDEEGDDDDDDGTAAAEKEDRCTSARSRRRRQPWNGEHSSIGQDEGGDDDNNNNNNSNDNNKTTYNSTSSKRLNTSSSSTSSSPHLMLRVLLHYGTPSIVRTHGGGGSGSGNIAAGSVSPGTTTPAWGSHHEPQQQPSRRVQFLGDDIRMMKTIWSNTLAHSFSPYLVTSSAGERLTPFTATTAMRAAGLSMIVGSAVSPAATPLPAQSMFRAADPRDRTKVIVGCQRGAQLLAKLEHRTVTSFASSSSTSSSLQRRASSSSHQTSFRRAPRSSSRNGGPPAASSSSSSSPSSPHMIAVYRLADFDPDRVGLDRNPPLHHRHHLLLLQQQQQQQQHHHVVHQHHQLPASYSIAHGMPTTTTAQSPTSSTAAPAAAGVIVEVGLLSSAIPSQQQQQQAFGGGHVEMNDAPFDDTASQRARHATNNMRSAAGGGVGRPSLAFDDDTASIQSLFSTVGSIRGGNSRSTTKAVAANTRTGSAALSSAVVKMFADTRLLMLSHEELKLLQHFAGALLARFLKGLDHDRRLDCLLFCLRRTHLEDVHHELTMPPVTPTDTFVGYSKKVTYRTAMSGMSGSGQSQHTLSTSVPLATSSLNNSTKSIGSRHDATRRIASVALEAILTQLLVMMDEIELKRWLRDVAELRELQDDDDGDVERGSRGSKQQQGNSSTTQRHHHRVGSGTQRTMDVEDDGGGSSSITTARERSDAPMMDDDDDIGGGNGFTNAAAAVLIPSFHAADHSTTFHAAAAAGALEGNDDGLAPVEKAFVALD